MDFEFLARHDMVPAPDILCTCCHQREYIVREKVGDGSVDQTNYLVHCLYCGETLGGSA